MNLIQIAQAQTDQAPSASAPTPPTPAVPVTPPPAAPAPTPPTATQTTATQTSAEPAPLPPAPDMFTQLLPLFFITAIVYFIVLRPQQRRSKTQKEALKNLRRGDTVITTGGLVGRVTKVVDDAEIEVELAQNVRVRVLRQAVTDVRAKGEPVKDQAAAGAAR